MTVNVSNLIKNPGERITVEQKVPAEVVREDIELPLGIMVKGVLENRAGMCAADLELSAEAALSCALCGKRFSQDMSVSVSFLIAENEEEALNLSEEAFAPNSDGELDICGIARELFILQLPFRFLCREDCKGLCPVCGADRNEIECSCVDRAPSPFDKLKGLFD